MHRKLSKIIFICAAIACVGLRIYLKLVTIDPATGFYEGNLFPATIFNLLLAAAVISLLVLGYLKKPAEKCTGRTSIRVLAALTGVSALLVSGWEILAVIDGIYAMGLSAAMVALLFQLCGAASGIVLLAVALRLRPDGTCRICPVLLLLPLVWQIYRLLTSFMAYTAIRSVSDQLLVVLTMVLFSPFLLAHGRVLGGVSPAKGLRQLAAFGLPFSLLAITSSVGEITAFFAGRSVTVAGSLPHAVFYLIAGVYAATLVLSSGGTVKVTETAEAAEEAEEAEEAEDTEK